MHRPLEFLLVAALLLPQVAVAAPLARDVRGRRVDLENVDLVVFWTLDDPGARAILDAADQLADRGVRVVAVNEDGATTISRVGAFAHGHASLPVVVDTDGAIRDRYGFPGLGALALEDGRAIARWEGLRGLDLAEVTARLEPEPLTASLDTE